jgi:cytochrome c-type biogenesis protein CcsB
MRRRKPGGGLFGAAASFVGWLALVALFASPYVFGRDIGGEIRHVNGILMSYWLYVHVTMVTASYALIGMSFLLACWWLFARVTGRGASLSEAPASTHGGFWRTLGRVFLLPIPDRPARESGAFAGDFTASRPQTLLQRLDAANLVILQLAFWILGAGVICGAIWADMSWGRPWGWDPKETFALVTWTVYLIIIHVRLVTRDKALWTAVLAVVGFFIMLFNWIGVNFFLVGLHSYA